MACSGLEQSIQYLQSGNVTFDHIKQVLSDCPQLCDGFYGKKTFQLAGPGVRLSFIIQVILTILVGTLQSFISYITPRHASSSTRLSIGRVQVVFDTVCSTGIFIYVVTMITSFVRLRQDPSAFECIMIQRLLEALSSVYTTTLVARIIQQQPNKVKLPARRWSLGQIWSLAVVLPLIGYYLSSMSARAPSAVYSRICAVIEAEKHSSSGPAHPRVPIPPSGNSMLFLVIAVCLLTIIGCIAIDNLRNWFWAWLRAVFTSRYPLIVAVSLWNIIALTGLGLNTWQLLRRQSAMSNAGVHVEWDFGQVVAVGLWIPALYQLLLTCLVGLNLTPEFNPDFAVAKSVKNLVSCLIEELYASSVGQPPKIEEETEEKDENTEESRPEAAKANTPELEKAALVASGQPAVQATDTTDQQIQTEQLTSLTTEHVADALGEKAPLMQ